MTTKNCPFCAEEILEEAKRCKHCKSDLPVTETPGLENQPEAIKDQTEIPKKKIGFNFLTLTIGVFVFIFFGVPIFSGIVSATPQPTIEILSSQDSQGTNTEYLLDFKVKDAKTVTVNGENQTEIKDGEYQVKISLNEPTTQIQIVAANSFKNAEEKLTINRDMTEEETIAEETFQKAQEAAQKEWEESDAGKICTEHTNWTKEDCEKIANNMVWIGMHAAMLVEEMGRANSINKSNYGSGEQTQWCWYRGYDLKCFYDYDGDFLIDAYN